MSDYLLRKHQQRIADAVCFARAAENLMYEKKIRLLEVQLAAAENDAARYRWLRDRHNNGDESEQWFVYGAHTNNLDGDIDKAMKPMVTPASSKPDSNSPQSKTAAQEP